MIEIMEVGIWCISAQRGADDSDVIVNTADCKVVTRIIGEEIWDQGALQMYINSISPP